MNAEATFHTVFVLFFALTAVLRISFHRRSGAHRERLHTERDGQAIGYLRLLALPWFGVLFLYLFSPSSLAWAALPLPLGLRWAGVGLAVLSLALLFWVHRALDKNFSGTLRIRADHTLVTHGPYRWVRHPMYTVFLLNMLTMFLLSANALLGLLSFTLLSAIITLRIPREEAMLIEAFGDAYRAYQKRTGRLLPRLLPAHRDVGPDSNPDRRALASGLES
jgi:protein-S-isoprenylcysteine O-methyltransferase Ste14